MDALSRLRTIPKGWERSSSGTSILSAVNEALSLPRSDMPQAAKHTHVPEGAQSAVELLKVLLRLVSEKHGVAAKVLASSDDLDKIATDGASADVPALQGWRKDLFGDPALKLISGEVALRFVDKRVEAVELGP